MEELLSFFKNTFLFKNVDTDIIESMLLEISVEKQHYEKGDIICSPENFDKKIGFISQGECVVARRSGGDLIPLNLAKKYDSFGVITCFSDHEDFPTLVTAKTACKVVYIDRDTLKALVERSSLISLNIIRFLANKVTFLNDKIATFSGGCIEEKLASYILTMSKKLGTLEFEFNKKKSAEALNCGRASLYRAISALESCGYIICENKKMIINDLLGLERTVK